MAYNMPKEFTLHLEKQINSPKNHHGKNVKNDVNGRFALVGQNLWDLKESKIIPGLWQTINPSGTVGLKLSDSENGSFLELCALPDGKVLTRFEKNISLELSPFGPFATTKLLKDNHETHEWGRGKIGQKKSLPIYSTASGKYLYTIEDSCVLGFFLSNSRVALVDAVGKISIYDLKSGKVIAKLKGLGRKPLFIRTDSVGKKLFIYGVNWKKHKAIYKLWDVENLTLLSEEEGEWIRFGEHISFQNGTHIVGDIALMDVDKKQLHEFWLGVYYNSPHVTSLTPLLEWPYFAAIVCRDKLGIKSNLEIWDITARKRLGFIAVEKRAHVVVPAGKNTVAVFHSVEGKPIYDDSNDPAVSLYSFEEKAVSQYPEQPEPGSYFFELSS